MKLQLLLSLASVASAFVLPDEQVLAAIPKENNRPAPNRWVDSVKDKVEHITENSKNLLEKIPCHVSEDGKALYEKLRETGDDAESWLKGTMEEADSDIGLERPPRHRKPHHPHKSNLTVYELIAKSKYTTKLARLISEDDELVEILNGTKANYTVFAPTDRAFEKIPKHHKKPSKEFIKALLTYHVSPEFYPAGRVLASHTIPTLLKSPSLGKEPMPQRLAIKLGLKGLTLNYYARIIAIDIFGSNGVIHAVDSLIIPPPPVLDIIEFLPGEFSTLDLALTKTGLIDGLNTTDNAGGTFFAPSNFAFQKLGPRINGFLFSKYGQKYLKALLEYHLVPDQTLYSDAFYKGTSVETTNGPQGYFHVDLQTLLEDRALAIDVSRFGPFITIKINGFSTVSVQDGVAKNGVIQVVSNVLIPPKKLSQAHDDLSEDEEMSLEEFKERLEPYVEGDNGEWMEL